MDIYENKQLIINGKVLIFTDMHVGLKNASKTRLAICAQVIKDIISYVKEHSIKTVLFLGDWHHCRNSTENNVLNISYKLMKALSNYVKVYMILGNHDLYMKNSCDIHSLIIFKDLKNVEIIDKPTQLLINNKLSVFSPWLSNLSTYQSETIDLLFGHFDVSHTYLIKSYIEDHSQNTNVNSNISLEIDNAIKTDQKYTAGNFIGNFVDIVKKGGLIFSGHIHGRREFFSKGRKFILVGSPYQQNLGEIDNKCGFYILNEDLSYTFHEISSTPKHITLIMSEIVNNKNYDFSIIKGNIIHKVYDIDIDQITDSKINQKINDWQPYEELLPDYQVDFSKNSDFTISNTAIELIKKSKLDYIKNYINNIDEKTLCNQQIDKKMLYSVIEDYYNSIVEEEK